MSATNGQTPVTSSYSTTPNAYTSVAGVTSPPSTCSGAMYAGVPEITPASAKDSDKAVASPAALRRARPKSVTTTRISWSGALGSTSITFGLLKSRCTTPTRCAAARPAAICRAMGRMSVGLESPLPVKPVGQRLAAEQLHRKKHDVLCRPAAPGGRWRNTS